VSGLGQSPADTAIVAGVVGLAHALGLEAVAEGVETAEQAARLAALGCNLARGTCEPPAARRGLLRWLDDLGLGRGAQPTESRPELRNVVGLV